MKRESQKILFQMSKDLHQRLNHKMDRIILIGARCLQVNAERVQVILDEGLTRRSRDAACSSGDGGTRPAGALTLLSGSESAALMKIGVRVLRGPDWKWGDQVCSITPHSLYQPLH